MLTKANISAIRYHRRFSRQQQQYEKAAAKAFYSAIKDQVRQFIEAARDYPTGLEIQAVNDINPLNLAKTIRRVALKVGAGYAKITEAEMTAEESGQKNFYGQPKRGLGHIMEVDWNQHPYETKANGTDYRQLIEAYLRLYGAKKVTGITETTRKWIVEQIVKGNQAGMTFDQVAKNLITDQINANRALRIARTESVAMMNLGRYLAANNSNFEKEKIWVDAHDDKVRPAGTDSVYDHHAADIRVARKLNMLFKVSGEYLMFPGDTAHGASAGNVVNCYLPDTVIQGDVYSAQRSFYSGQCIEIITVGGKRLSVTPNHGIFTDKGLIPAKGLKIGDNLICNSEKVYSGLGLIDNYIKKKFRAANIFRSLVVVFGSEELMTGALDFDGDGESLNGKVDIVSVGGSLENRRIPKILKGIKNILFKKSHFMRRFLGGLSPKDTFGRGNKTAFGRFVSLFVLLFPGIGRHFRPLNSFGLGRCSKLDALRFKSKIDTRPRDAEFLGQLIGTKSVKIHFDKIIEIKIFEFSGHVYDFSSINGTNIANNIYTSNCRCTFALRTKRDDQGRMITKPRPMIITETGVENFPEEATPVDISAPVTIVDFITALMNGATLGGLLGLSFLDLFNNKP